MVWVQRVADLWVVGWRVGDGRQGGQSAGGLTGEVDELLS